MEGASLALMMGGLTLVGGALSPGCSTALLERNARLVEQNRRLKAAHARDQRALAENGRKLGALYGRLALAQQAAVTQAVRAAKARSRFEGLQTQVAFHERAAKEAAFRGRQKALSMCHSLPSRRSVTRHLKRRFRRPLVLARKRSGQSVVAVVSARATKGKRRLVAVYQDKTQRRLASVTLAEGLSRKAELAVRVRAFLGRFLAVDVVVRQQVARKQEAVVVQHYILRPTAGGIELACVTRGSSHVEDHNTGYSTHARKVSFLPVPTAATPSFELEVLEARAPGATGTITAGTTPIPRYWTVSLGESGRCTIRRAARRSSKRNALEGLF